MRSVTYKSVQDQVSGFLGWDPENLLVSDAAMVNRFINRRVQFGWESFFWPEWTVVEQRFFRPAWSSATTYAAGNEVFHLASMAYYVCLSANTNQAPADANNVPNLAYWAASQATYSGANWASGTTYVRGSVVYYPVTNAFYQLFTASTSSAAPTDTANWGLLVPFKRMISYTQSGQTVIGDVKDIWDKDPEAVPSQAKRVKFILRSSIQVLGLPNVVWVEFRLTYPTFTGPVFAATQNYNAGARVYFAGDYYTCILTTTAFQDPTNATYWTVIPFPYVLSKYVASGAYADVQGKTEGEQDKLPAENDEAYQALAFEFDKLERQSGQTSQMNLVQCAGGY